MFISNLYKAINALGRKVAEIDQAGVRTEFLYDEAGNLTGVNDAMGGETRYSYDPGGNLLTITDPNNHTTTFTYDELGRKTSRTLPEGMAETWQYQDCCNASSHTDFNGATISYEYDLMKREIKRTYPDGKKIERQYNDRGQVKRVVYTGHQFSGGEAYSDRVFTYDPTTGKLIRDDKEDGQYIAYSYDVAGNLIETSYSGGHAVHYTHDALNRLKTVTDENGKTIYTYDAVGNRKSMAYPNDTIATYEYDSLNRLVYLENSGPNGVISSYDYTLGPAGNRQKIVERYRGPADGDTAGPSPVVEDVCEYDYDGLYRLTREERTSPDADRTYWIEYEYDAFGNRTEMNAGGVTTTYTYDKNDRLESEAGPNGGTTYSWDANGNMTGKAGPDPDSGTQIEWVYDWNHDNKMARAEKDGSFESSYSYDFRGERISKATASDETAFLIDNNNQTGYSQTLREVDSTNEEKVSYTFGDDLISQDRADVASGEEGVSFLHYDGLGSTRALTTPSASVTDHIAYLAFGAELAKTGTTKLNHLFTGEAYDFNLGYYYLRARLYNPNSALFISLDPFKGLINSPMSLHKYLYVHANPVLYKDFSGMYGGGLNSLVLGLAGMAVIAEIMMAYTAAVLGSFAVGFGIGLYIGHRKDWKENAMCKGGMWFAGEVHLGGSLVGVNGSIVKLCMGCISPLVTINRPICCLTLLCGGLAPSHIKKPSAGTDIGFALYTKKYDVEDFEGFSISLNASAGYIKAAFSKESAGLYLNLPKSTINPSGGLGCNIAENPKCDTILGWQSISDWDVCREYVYYENHPLKFANKLKSYY